jgi:hypothetical protein
MSVLWTFSYDKSSTMVLKGGNTYVMETSYRCNSDRSSVPPELSATGVSAKSWAKIVDVCNKGLLPVIKAANELDALLKQETRSYTDTQMVKGTVGFFGLESWHEKSVLTMIHESAILNNNLSLMTYKVITLANALLNKHNVLVEPRFAATTEMSLKTIGLAFVSMDEFE